MSVYEVIVALQAALSELIERRRGIAGNLNCTDGRYARAAQALGTSRNVVFLWDEARILELENERDKLRAELAQLRAPKKRMTGDEIYAKFGYKACMNYRDVYVGYETIFAAHWGVELEGK